MKKLTIVATILLLASCAKESDYKKCNYKPQYLDSDGIYYNVYSGNGKCYIFKGVLFSRKKQIPKEHCEPCL